MYGVRLLSFGRSTGLAMKPSTNGLPTTSAVPAGCELCGTDEVWLIYDWSNISGNYLRDISDWERLCRGAM